MIITTTRNAGGRRIGAAMLPVPAARTAVAPD